MRPALLVVIVIEQKFTPELIEQDGGVGSVAMEGPTREKVTVPVGAYPPFTNAVQVTVEVRLTAT